MASCALLVASPSAPGLTAATGQSICSLGRVCQRSLLTPVWGIITYVRDRATRHGQPLSPSALLYSTERAAPVGMIHGESSRSTGCVCLGRRALLHPPNPNPNPNPNPDPESHTRSRPLLAQSRPLLHSALPLPHSALPLPHSALPLLHDAYSTTRQPAAPARRTADVPRLLHRVESLRAISAARAAVGLLTQWLWPPPHPPPPQQPSLLWLVAARLAACTLSAIASLS